LRGFEENPSFRVDSGGQRRIKDSGGEAL